MTQLVTIEELIDRHAALLYRVAYRLAGNPHDAEDLVQQTFMIAQQKQEQLREEQAATAWLCTILKNTFLKRGKNRLPVLPLERIAEPAQSPVVEEQEAVSSETLQAALELLSEEYRVPLVLFYFQELSYKQIADVLEVPIGTVMSRLARGKTQLKQRLNGLGVPANRESGTGR